MVGDEVVLTYFIPNTRNVPLEEINVTDNQGVVPIY